MTAPIRVLNPNSTASVTAGIDAAVEPLRAAGAPPILCETLSSGPPAIETDADVAAVAPAVAEWIAAREGDACAFVVACFSDPGVALAGARASVPVLGMAECGYRAAAALGGRFGVISILESSTARHRAHVEALGLVDRLAGDLPLDLGVLELADEGVTFARLLETGARLRDRHGAASLVLGCAGMAAYPGRLEAALGVPVIEPVGAAVRRALGLRAGAPARSAR